MVTVDVPSGQSILEGTSDSIVNTSRQILWEQSLKFLSFCHKNFHFFGVNIVLLQRPIIGSFWTPTYQLLPTLKLNVVNETSLKVFEMNNIRARLSSDFFYNHFISHHFSFLVIFLVTHINCNSSGNVWTVKSSMHY